MTKGMAKLTLCETHPEQHAFAIAFALDSICDQARNDLRISAISLAWHTLSTPGMATIRLVAV